MGQCWVPGIPGPGIPGIPGPGIPGVPGPGSVRTLSFHSLLIFFAEYCQNSVPYIELFSGRS